MEGTSILRTLFTPFYLLLPFFLYAEIHYRFRYFFSFLKKNEPEIIVDAPHRIEPGHDIPILFLVKDAHLYPCIVENITVRVYKERKLISTQIVESKKIHLNEKWWWRIYPIKTTEQLTGTIECDVEFTLQNSKGTWRYHNDNYRTASHKPLTIFISSYPLPTFNSLYLGEFHSHSTYTDDQVEYGAPIAASLMLAKAIGLSFFVVTDHSYDLDDDPSNFLVNHPDTPKWYSFLEEIKALQNNSDVTVLGGEEVSCRNSQNTNVHFLLINNNKFYHGSGDSAERWFRTRSEYSIYEISQHNEKQLLKIAAHPCEPVPFLQRVLLGRGMWSITDFLNSDIDGIQFINGELNNGFSNGYRLWIQLLLQGKHITIFAGNDAHGNFNRYRQIGLPFFKISESHRQLFGKMRTGVFAATKSKNDLLESALLGKTLVTSGPVANITDPKTNQTLLGSILSKDNYPVLHFSGKSSPEFGTLDKFLIRIGTVGGAIEYTLYEQTSLADYTFEIDLPIPKTHFSYIRLEVWTNLTTKVAKPNFCLTNPVWFHTTN